ncbi:hypothetical protein SCACP_01330 [Sporomusa carbonis]
MDSIIISAGNNQLNGVIHSPAGHSDKTLIISHGFRGTKAGGGRAVSLA